MRVSNQEIKREERMPGSWFGRMSERIRGIFGDRAALASAIFAFAGGFLLAGCHIAFGSYPLAIGFLSALPVGVLPASVGAILGALSLGRRGWIYVITSLLVVALRMLISTPKEEKGGKKTFSEPLLLRISAAVTAGFVAALYEGIAVGLSLATVAYGLVTVTLGGLSAFVFSWIFDAGVGLSDFLFGKRAIFTETRDRRTRYARLLFGVSVLTLAYCLDRSLGRYEWLGIGASTVFAAAVTLFAAKRFGFLGGGAAGLAVSLSLSADAVAGFVLAGVAGGLLFTFGDGVGVFGALLTAGGWFAYAGGIGGFLGVMPEFAAASVAILPFCRLIREERQKPEPEAPSAVAKDMVGTMALAFRTGAAEETKGLASALAGIGETVREFGRGEESADDDRKEIFSRFLSRFHAALSEDEKENLFLKIVKGEPISDGDVSFLPEGERRGFLEAYAVACESAEEMAAKNRSVALAGEELALIGTLVGETSPEAEGRFSVDPVLSEKAKQVFADYGFPDGEAQVFGTRRKRLIAAGTDADGRKITSPELLGTLGELFGAKIGKPQFYRRGNMVLMECETQKKYEVAFGIATTPRTETEASGDRSACFVGKDDRFYAVLSDGMGSGNEAAKTADFTVRFLKGMLSAGASGGTSMRLVNTLLRQRREECPATVDLFSFDLLTGEALFLKSGAAPSYVKRGSTLFRIRSRTLPIGVLERVDAEQIKAEIRPGDTVILLSDGVSMMPEDAPWLLTFLGKPSFKDPTSYAKAILSLAAENCKTKDDMTVIVLRIEKREGA